MKVTLEEKLKAYEETGSYRAAAKLLGMTEGPVRRTLNSYFMKQNIPDGQKLKGTSVLYDKEGNKVLEWVKTNADVERQIEMMKEAVEELKSQVKPLPPQKSNVTCNDDMLVMYTISDLHLGMFAHKEEGGDDWDLGKAESKINGWVDMAVSMSPPAKQAILLQLGDFLHQDSLDPVTPKSRHVLDSASRFQKIVRVAIGSIRRAVTRMLEKHESVHIIMADANHDPTSSVWMRELFYELYKNEPRVTVDRTEHPYYCFEWGNTSIFAHHGDKRNLSNVSQVFAALYRDVFGRTKYSYGHIGHFHHSASKEDSLMQVQIHPTLAARDAYASRYGYISQRKAKTIFYSKKHGYAGEFAITPEMIP